MRDLCLLIKPKLLGLKNRFARSEGRDRKKAIIMGGLGVGFFVGLFVISSHVLKYFQSVEIIGNLLAHHLLGMILLTLFSLLVFSHIITGLSNLYLSRDLEFCHSIPIQIEDVFISRAIYTAMNSSWMLIIFGMPIFLAYSYVYSPGPIFYFTLLHLNLAMVVIAAGIGILLTMVLVYIFPAQRTRDIMFLLVIIMVVSFYIFFRILRPERLVDPDSFFTVAQYLTSLKGTASPYLPTQWIAETLWDQLQNKEGASHLFDIALIWSTALATVIVNVWVSRSLYFGGFSKAQEAKKRKVVGKWILDSLVSCLTVFVNRDIAACLSKDIRAFFRDNTQWTQLLLLGALVIVYVFNFKALPLDKSPIQLDFLQNELAFLNMGLAGFVLSAVSVRFVFPAISSEGEAFWIIRSSPMGLRRLLIGKYIMFLLPMLILAELLIVLTNYFLEVTSFMMILSSLTMFFLVFGIISLGIGFGAIYPNFRYENIAQAATSFGGLIYMIVSALFIGIVILLEAGPVYILFLADVRGKIITPLEWLFIVISFFLILVVFFMAIYKPIGIGVKALNRFE